MKSKPVIESIKIELLDDTNPDTSCIGEYTDKLEPGVIVRSENEFIENLGEDFEPSGSGRDYRFFKPCAGDEKVGTKDYYKYAMQDYKRMEGLNNGDWSYIGIRASAVVKYAIGQGNYRLETLTSGGLWGIESDSDNNYLVSVMKEELNDLKDHLETFNVSLKDFDEMAEEAIRIAA